MRRLNFYRTAIKKVCDFTVHHFFLCVCCLILFSRRDVCFSRQRTFPLRTTEKCHRLTDWVQRTTFCRKPSVVSRRKTPCKGAKSSCTSEPVATKLRKVLPAPSTGERGHPVALRATPKATHHASDDAKQRRSASAPSDLSPSHGIRPSHHCRRAPKR